MLKTKVIQLRFPLLVVREGEVVDLLFQKVLVEEVIQQHEARLDLRGHFVVLVAKLRNAVNHLPYVRNVQISTWFFERKQL